MPYGGNVTQAMAASVDILTPVFSGSAFRIGWAGLDTVVQHSAGLGLRVLLRHLILSFGGEWGEFVWFHLLRIGSCCVAALAGTLLSVL